MLTLIDTSLWIDFTRMRSPQSLKRFIAPYILNRSAHTAEPVIFEVLRHAAVDELRPLNLQFETLPRLDTPPDLWKRAALLGQACRRKNLTFGSLDLLVAAVALHHDAELITFDRDFSGIA
ncbi:MAG: PIN domain-containing protein, partial [Vicinamibacteria bacterium]